jgi:membrane-associated phospholipid phosphatase
MNLITEIDPDRPADLALPALELPQRKGERLARWVSNLFSPPLLAVFGLCLVASQFDRPSDYLWILYYLCLVIGIPLSYLVWKIRRGEITDFHIRVREQRLKPMLVGLTCGVIGWVSLWIGNAPRILTAIAGMAILQVSLLLLVTTRWKISGHGASIASLAVFTWGLYGSLAVPLLLAVPLVGWARVRLNRHTPAQVLAGMLVGIGMTLGLLQLI